jgi:hypothetical protein
MGLTEFKSDDDAVALEYARKNVLHRAIEVWQGDRLVGTARPGEKLNTH